VKKSYLSGARHVRILNGVNLELDRSDAVAIVGASGVGKSTLLHLLGALDRPDEGKIALDGADYRGMNDVTLADVRCRRVGFIYQFHHLLPEFNALENVMVPGIILGERRTNLKRSFFSYLWNIIHPSVKSEIFSELRQRAEKILSDVGLGERMTHRPAKLSGGEQQRVALARALINDPDLVLADEPTGNLDLATGEKILDMILEHTVGRGKAIVLVTHNPDIAARIGTIHQLKNGVLTKVTA
jgi:lipoprotein-releasing system ATP-binding protein